MARFSRVGKNVLDHSCPSFYFFVTRLSDIKEENIFLGKNQLKIECEKQGADIQIKKKNI